MIRAENLSKKAFKDDPDGQKKIKLFLKKLQNDIRLKLVGTEVEIRR
ncbi:hypothetical protein SAMN04487887_1052 [Enterococcus casseliflavus]|nr:hypothetical protein [Enterococcus casseliflavus]SFD89555.1 hypothetical protein SAMN04487887_1052 [Enterococcus casseliflavus]